MSDSPKLMFWRLRERAGFLRKFAKERPHLEDLVITNAEQLEAEAEALLQDHPELEDEGLIQTGGPDQLRPPGRK